MDKAKIHNIFENGVCFKDLEELPMQNGQTFDPSKYRIDLSENVPDPHPLLSVNGVMAFSPQNISVNKGKAKQGKTFTNVILASAFIAGRCGAVTSQPLPNRAKVKILDTEQGTAHVHRVARRIHRLCGFSTSENNPFVEVYAIKDIDYKQRFELLKTVANDPQTGLIIVDGIVDMMLDFNDLAESSRIRDEILRLVKETDTHIIFTIHTNKADNNSRGHAGAILEQKSQTVLITEKDGDFFSVTPAYCRDMPFEPFGFRISDGLPIEADATDRPNPNHTKQREVFKKILTGTSTMPYKELIANYIDHTGLKEDSAKKHIALHYSNGFLDKNNGAYWIKNNSEV